MGKSGGFLLYMLKGMSKFVLTYRKEYDKKQLVSRLSKCMPSEIKRVGDASIDHGNPEKRYALVIVDIYNKSRKSDTKLDPVKLMK